MEISSRHQDKYRRIGNRIAYYRIKAGLSQQELADRINISKSYLSKIEAPGSIKTFSLEVLFDISDSLGIDIKNLL